MPTSETGRPTDRAAVRSARGLTLIELVVVVAILGILALPVMLRLGGGGLFGGARSAQSAAARLGAELAQMRDRALFGRQVLGLTPGPQGWTWSARGGGGDWALADTIRLQGLALTWQVDGTPLPPPRPGGNDDAAPPPILLMPDGRGVPFAVRLGAGGPLCSFDGWGPVTCTDR